jgi:hypothetical protein
VAVPGNPASALEVAQQKLKNSFLPSTIGFQPSAISFQLFLAVIEGTCKRWRGVRELVNLCASA